MFDFRYHIISIVAVFLALGIGIVMGTMVVEEGVISKQEKVLISRIETDFDALRKENKEANDRLKQAALFQQGIVPYVVTNKLITQNVALVVTTSCDDTVTANIRDTIGKAGGRVVSTTTLAGGLGLNSKANLNKVNSLLGLSNLTDTQIKPHLMSEIGKQITTAQNPQFMQDLKTMGAVKLDGDYSLPVQSIIVIGGTDGPSTAEELDVPMIESILALNVIVVGTETTTIKNSYMKEYQKLGISTVDDIDTPAGWIATVMILSGQSGNYGLKSTAKQLLPALMAE